jgi:uncharacterized membrane protein
MPAMVSVVLALALLATAWSAGFFWSWSFSVMPGLDRAAPEAAIAAMRSINAAIRTPGFAFVFFGPAILALLAAALAGFAGQRVVVIGAALAAGIYLAGVILVTFAVNLPLNDGLAAASLTEGTAVPIWRDYSAAWTWWNHLRTGAATLAFLCLLYAAVRA